LPDGRLTLILGGARSGKSRHAEALIESLPPPRTYVATGQAFDDEMRERIELHKARRDGRWTTVDAPLDLGGALCSMDDGRPVLVDCLTLWLSNLLFAGQAARQAEAGEAIDCPLLRDETAALIDALPQLPGRVILVSNEVGWGVVPMHPVSRLFADEQGRLNQRVAAACQQVTLVAAGLPLVLKGGPTPA
jgi:adenosylcobinamide kinase/adenosylcobinamide-phosphate guanylyltransferase